MTLALNDSDTPRIWDAPGQAVRDLKEALKLLIEKRNALSEEFIYDAGDQYDFEKVAESFGESYDKAILSGVDAPMAESSPV